MLKYFGEYKVAGLDKLPLEEHPDEGLVERAGYMSTEDMVSQLLIAGANLAVYREAEYGWEEEVPDDAPAQRPLSLLDAQLQLKSVNARIAAQRAAIVQGEKPAEEKLAEEKLEEKKPVEKKKEAENGPA